MALPFTSIKSVGYCPNCEHASIYYRKNGQKCDKCGTPIILVDVRSVKLPVKIRKLKKRNRIFLILLFVSIPILAGVSLLFIIASAFFGALMDLPVDFLLNLIISVLFFIIIPTYFISFIVIAAFWSYYFFKSSFEPQKYFCNLVRNFPPPKDRELPEGHEFTEGLNSIFKYCPYCDFVNAIDSDFCMNCGKEISGI